jgi:hypothetical protein
MAQSPPAPEVVAPVVPPSKLAVPTTVQVTAHPVSEPAATEATPSPTMSTVIVQMPKPDAKSDMLDFGKAIGWPLAIVIIAFLFRKQIADKIGSIQKIDGGGIVAAWTREAEETADEAVTAVAPAATDRVEGAEVTPEEAHLRDLFGARIIEDSPHRVQFERIARADPSTGVLFMWGIVETRLIALADALRVTFEPSRIQSLISHLGNTGRLNPGVLSVLENLRRLRNEAAHLRNLTFNDADAYYRSAVLVLSAVDREIARAG